VFRNTAAEFALDKNVTVLCFVVSCGTGRWQGGDEVVK